VALQDRATTSAEASKKPSPSNSIPSLVSGLQNWLNEGSGTADEKAPQAKELSLAKGQLLKNGSSGENVKQLQEMLNARGAKLEADGKFGPKTKRALRTFQDQNKLTPDGVVGPQTLAALNAQGNRSEAAGPIQAEGPSSQGSETSLPQPPAPNNASAPPSTLPGDLPDPGKSRHSGTQAQARGTGYYPFDNKMEGGHFDRKGKRLNTLQDFLDGKAPYVSVAMDHKAGIPYGQPVRIAELEKKYGREIPFRVVDTRGAFKGKGTSRIDICTRDRKASMDPTINGPLTLKFP